MIPALLSNYAPADLSFEKGEGAYLFGNDGRRYLDFFAGIAVTSLGHNNPKIVEAITKQASSLMHISNLYRIPGQEELAQNLEQLNAREALERNDFNSFQLAQSRQDLSAKRLEQLRYRSSLLDLRATQTARVLSVLPNTMAGGFLNVGTELARLQPTQVFEALIDVNPVDASRLHAGQAGELFFKGLPGQVFTIETLGVPVLGPSPDGQTMALKIEVKVLDQDQSALIPGLSGYAKIHVGEAPRFFSVFRKISDYVRFNIWKFLGFDI